VAFASLDKKFLYEEQATSGSEESQFAGAPVASRFSWISVLDFSGSAGF
jgi:hypothetical protein